MNILYTTFKGILTLLFLSAFFGSFSSFLHAEKISEETIEIVEEESPREAFQLPVPAKKISHKHPIVHIPLIGSLLEPIVPLVSHVIGRPTKYVAKTLAHTAHHGVKIVKGTTDFLGSKAVHATKNIHKYVTLKGYTGKFSLDQFNEMRFALIEEEFRNLQLETHELRKRVKNLEQEKQKNDALEETDNLDELYAYQSNSPSPKKQKNKKSQTTAEA